MSCFTRVRIDIEDNTWNERAREALGLPAKGKLTQGQARLVRTEAGVIKATAMVRRQQPNAVIRRRGNKLQVTVRA